MLTRSSRIARTALIGLIAFMFAATPTLAMANDRAETGASGLTDGSAGDIQPEAFVAPPTGYTVVYHFTGARTGFSGAIATTVHCSNLLGATTPVRVEFYDFAGVLRGTGNLSVAQYRTSTFTASDTGFTALYNEDVAVVTSGVIDQGVVRVLKKGTGKVICAAQVLDAVNVPPTFVLPLVHFGPNGSH